MSKTRVLVIDDSALMRNLMTVIVNREPDMEVVGCAPDPLRAREMIRELDPDVLTLDIEMPRMDGLDFLERLMRLRPMPVVMVSTLTDRGSEATLRAMELGAVDFVPKPKLDIAAGIEAAASQITDRIRAAARARVRPAPAAAARPAALGEVGDRRVSTEKIIAIGSSTGGTEALREFLMQLPADAPGIVITQHMPAGFTRSFAARLDQLCRLAVKEAEDGDRILPGHAYVAPGDRHLAVRRSGANYVCALSDAEPVNRHKPSVEVLFNSVAEYVGPNAVGVMLTGMGRDGAAAMRAMREAGAYNFAQDEASCVVFGMPKEAIAAGAVHEVVALDAMPGRVLQHLRSRPHGNRV